jgi:hypothetical protein
MPDAHDPAALVRHAAQAGDWRLVYLITRMLSGRSTPPPPPTAARRAYTTLVLKFRLAGDLCDYDRC